MTLVRRNNPDMVHARSDERGYALVEINSAAAHCDFRATPFPVKAGATLYSQARMTVVADQAGVQKA
jgi:alkaline phosphatase D